VITSADWYGLQDTIAGEVVLPGSPEYDAVRKPAMVRFHDVRPRAVVRCVTDADVGEVIGFAKRVGLRIAIRSGGHCFAGRSSTDGVVMDVSPMRSVTVTDGVVTVGAGTRLGELYDALDRHGLTIAAGCGPTVGIAGLTLGGGLGILGRRYGLTCDQLRRAQVVLADGRILECDERHDADLFWALRGAGGGTLGVVTSLVVDTVSAPPATGFHLVWPHTAAASVIEAWQAWAPDAPDELAASLLVRAGRDADRPPMVNVFGAMLGVESATLELLDELVARAGHDPTSTDHVHASYREIKRYLVDLGDQMEGGVSHGSPVEPGPAYSRSEFFRRPLPTGAIAALVDNLLSGRMPGESRALDFTPWTGAYNRVPQHATAFVHRAERFLVKHELVLDPDASTATTDAGRLWLTRSWAMMHPWGSGGVYPNFPDLELENAGRAYYRANLERLIRVKRKYDPDDVFGIGLAGAPLAD
jgi:FAD/FMN-containing dehydrogenase